MASRPSSLRPRDTFQHPATLPLQTPKNPKPSSPKTPSSIPKLWTLKPKVRQPSSSRTPSELRAVTLDPSDSLRPSDSNTPKSVTTIRPRATFRTSSRDPPPFRFPKTLHTRDSEEPRIPPAPEPPSKLQTPTFHPSENQDSCTFELRRSPPTQSPRITIQASNRNRRPLQHPETFKPQDSEESRSLRVSRRRPSFESSTITLRKPNLQVTTIRRPRTPCSRNHSKRQPGWPLLSESSAALQSKSEDLNSHTTKPSPNSDQWPSPTSPQSSPRVHPKTHSSQRSELGGRRPVASAR